MPKRDDFIRIPLPEDERKQLEREAQREHLDLATWAKRVLQRAAERARAAKEDAPPGKPPDA
jgi:hypothetical protein